MTQLNSDQLLSELDESIPQGVPNATRHEQDASDGLGSLDELLADSMSDQEERAQYIADLKVRKRGFAGMSKEEVDFCNSRMQVFERERIWRPVANIAVFALFKCENCLSEKRVFARWMQQQASRTNATARRFDTVREPIKSLSTITAEEVRKVQLCTSCAHQFDLDTHGAVSLEEVLK